MILIDLLLRVLGAHHAEKDFHSLTVYRHADVPITGKLSRSVSTHVKPTRL